MYKTNKKIQQLANGVLAIMLLAGSNAMAQESLTESASTPPQVTDKWQRIVVESITSQLQQSSDSLIAIQPVSVPQDIEWTRDIETPDQESPVQLADDEPASLRFVLQDWQPQKSASKHLSQVEG